MAGKIIFSDIDGTLINSKLQVTPKTKKALRKEIGYGAVFVPVSARMPKAIMTVVSQITKACPMVAYNGALVLDELGHPLNSQFMTARTAMDICQYVESQPNNAVWNIYSGYVWYGQKGDSPLIKDEEKTVKVKATRATIKQMAKLKGVHKILVIGRSADLNQMQRFLIKKYPKLFFVKSAPHLLEIVKRGVSKSSGIKKLAAAFNVDLRDCYAFGDNYNDEDMLKAVGHPYLMGNAPAYLKLRIKNITLDNDHDGIAAALAKIKD